MVIPRPPPPVLVNYVFPVSSVEDDVDLLVGEVELVVGEGFVHLHLVDLPVPVPGVLNLSSCAPSSRFGGF